MKENIALFDLDGTLCDYDGALIEKLNNLRCPQEGKLDEMPRGDLPSWFSARANLIRSSVDWWANLPQFKLGMDVWEVAGNIGFRRMILTAGPRRNPNAWAGKKMWIDNNLGEDVEVTITRDKGLVYGRMFVDDWPEYIMRWLEWRPRGLVIMPAHKKNRGFVHPQVIRYDGKNLEEVQEAMVKLYFSKEEVEESVIEECGDKDDTYIISKSELVTRLVEKYTKSPNEKMMSASSAVAMICDEVLDKSGEILGRVRRAHERKTDNDRA